MNPSSCVGRHSPTDGSLRTSTYPYRVHAGARSSFACIVAALSADGRAVTRRGLPPPSAKSGLTSTTSQGRVWPPCALIGSSCRTMPTAARTRLFVHRHGSVGAPLWDTSEGILPQGASTSRASRSATSTTAYAATTSRFCFTRKCPQPSIGARGYREVAGQDKVQARRIYCPLRRHWCLRSSRLASPKR